MIKTTMKAMFFGILIFSCSDDNTPKQQLDFVSKIESFQENYESQEGNDVAQEQIADDAQAYIESFGKCTNWTGTVLSINNSLGDTWIVVQPSNSNNIELKLWPDGSLFENESKWKETDMYKLLPSLHVDDQIVFSGTVKREMSITDYGMMSEPEIQIEPEKISIVK